LGNLAERGFLGVGSRGLGRGRVGIPWVGRVRWSCEILVVVPRCGLGMWFGGLAVRGVSSEVVAPCMPFDPWCN